MEKNFVVGCVFFSCCESYIQNSSVHSKLAASGNLIIHLVLNYTSKLEGLNSALKNKQLKETFWFKFVE